LEPVELVVEKYRIKFKMVAMVQILFSVLTPVTVVAVEEELMRAQVVQVDPVVAQLKTLIWHQVHHLKVMQVQRATQLQVAHLLVVVVVQVLLDCKASHKRHHKHHGVETVDME
jgi:hypothetical protein